MLCRAVLLQIISFGSVQIVERTPGLPEFAKSNLNFSLNKMMILNSYKGNQLN